MDEVRRSGLGERIVFADFVTDDILPALYNAADLFVFPSFYEGFGLPVVEAMACGRPVVCSSASALPEVVDGAALLFGVAPAMGASRADVASVLKGSGRQVGSRSRIWRGPP